MTQTILQKIFEKSSVNYIFKEILKCITKTLRRSTILPLPKALIANASIHSSSIAIQHNSAIKPAVMTGAVKKDPLESRKPINNRHRTDHFFFFFVLFLYDNLTKIALHPASLKFQAHVHLFITLGRITEKWYNNEKLCTRGGKNIKSPTNRPTDSENERPADF